MSVYCSTYRIQHDACVQDRSFSYILAQQGIPGLSCNFPCPSTGINHFPKEPWLYALDAIGVLSSIEVRLLQGLSVGKLGNTVWICLFATYHVYGMYIYL